jgi:hypothetical protein
LSSREKSVRNHSVTRLGTFELMSKLLSYCPLCTGTHIEQLYEASDPHYGIPGSYRVVRCTDCSLVFLNPMFSDEELTALHPPDYYATATR